MPRILLTGATGALGQAMIEYLTHSGSYEIFATTSKKNGNGARGNVVFLPGDFRNPIELSNAFNLAKPEIIFHLGASFTNNFSDVYLLNVAPAIQLLDLIERNKQQTRIVLIGSAAEYGVINVQANPISEDYRLAPVSAYGLSKAWQTQLLGLYTEHEVDVVCARIFNLYGPGISESLFAGRLQNQINNLKAGRQSYIEVGSLAAIRDYIATNQAVKQLMDIANYGVSGNIYHVGSGVPISMRDFLLLQLKLHEIDPSLVREDMQYSNRQGYDIPIIFANMKKTRELHRE